VLTEWLLAVTNSTIGVKEDTFATGDFSSRGVCQFELIGKRRALAAAWAA
jgi:hypothetical protein